MIQRRIILDHWVKISKPSPKSVGPSMLPTISPAGDLVVIYKYGTVSECIRRISIGDVVVLVSPTDPYKILLKRLIGLVRATSFDPIFGIKLCSYVSTFSQVIEFVWIPPFQRKNACT